MIILNKENRLRQILSVFIALLIWFYVASIENPISSKSIQVPIELVNLPNHYQGVPYDNHINLVVEGRTKRLQSITADDFKAEVDLSKVKLGENLLDIIIKMPSGLKIVKKQPNQVIVDIRKLSERTMPITYIYNGRLKSGLKIDGEPNLSVKNIKIYGSNDLIDSIYSAAVDIDLDTIKESSIVKRPIIFYDNLGNILSSRNIKSSVTEVNVEINVSLMANKSIPINLVFSEEAPDGYSIDDLSYDLDEVILYGENKRLDEVNEVFTKPISWKQLIALKTLSIELNLPEGLEFGNQKTVTLSLNKLKDNEKNMVEEVLILPIKILGNTRSKNIFLSDNSVEVNYKGGKKPSEALVDVSGLEVGQHELVVNVNGNGVLENNKVIVTIENNGRE